MKIIFKDTSMYEEAAMRTAKDFGNTKMNLIHSAMGVTSDGGEYCTAIKAHAVYGKELDAQYKEKQTLRENAIEELGDTLWFIALGCKHLGTTMAEVMGANIEKLAKRYPDKYSDEAAIARADKVTVAGIDFIRDDSLAPNEVKVVQDTRYHHQKLMDACPSNAITFASPNYIDAQNYRYFATSLEVNYDNIDVSYKPDTYVTVVYKGSEAWNNWYNHASKVPA